MNKRNLVIALSALLVIVFGILSITTFFSSDYVRAKDKVEYLEMQREKYQNNEYSTYSEENMERAKSNLTPIENRGILFAVIAGCSIVIFAVSTYLAVSSKKNPQKEKITNTKKNMSGVPDELKKFKELLDLGAITQEEFEKKKKQIMDL